MSHGLHRRDSHLHLCPLVRPYLQRATAVAARLGDLTLDCAVGQLPDGSYIDLLIGRKMHQVFLPSANKIHHDYIDLLESSTTEFEKVYVPRFLATEGLRGLIEPAMVHRFMPYTYKTLRVGLR